MESVGEGVESPGCRRVRGDRLEGAVRQLPVLRYRAAAFVLGEPECQTQNVLPRATGSNFRQRWVSEGFARIPSYRLSRLYPCRKECPPEQACLLGCGVTTGVGAALYTGGVRRGSTVAVYGCGGVGCSVIMGAKLANAKTIIGVDIADNKLAWAKEFGATHTVDATKGDPVEAIKEITGGNGVDHSFEAVGTPATLLQALWSRDLAGTCTLIGVPDPTMVMELPMLQFFGLGGSLRVSWYGDNLPSRDFPMLANWYLQGKLDLDRAVTKLIKLEDVEEAFEEMERGEVLRSVIQFPS